LTQTKAIFLACVNWTTEFLEQFSFGSVFLLSFAIWQSFSQSLGVSVRVSSVPKEKHFVVFLLLFLSFKNNLFPLHSVDFQFLKPATRVRFEELDRSTKATVL